MQSVKLDFTSQLLLLSDGRVPAGTASELQPVVNFGDLLLLRKHLIHAL
jgi:hypothetical protein